MLPVAMVFEMLESQVPVELSVNNRDYVSYGLEYEYQVSKTRLEDVPKDVTVESWNPTLAAIMPEQV